MQHRTLLTFVFLLVLAAGLRFYKLGDSSWHLDELFTTLETKLLVGEIPITENTSPQYYRLPRMIFASHLVHYLNYKLFGEDEFGSRVLPAVMGTLSVGIVFLLAKPLFGFSTALILALMLCLSPEHLARSQLNRFYIQPFLLSSIVLLLGAWIAQRKNTLSAARWVGPVAVLMVLSHSITAVCWGALLCGFAAQFLLDYFRKITDNEEKPFSILISILHSPFSILICWSLVLLVIAWFHIKPLATGWNASGAGTWGYSPVHAAMSFVNQLGVPTLLFAAAGWILLCKSRNLYWSVCTPLLGLAVVVLPLKMTWNPQYNFLFMFPFYVCAAVFVGKVFELLLGKKCHLNSPIAIAWVAAAVLLPFSSLVSYYIDGNCPDLRSACRYVQEHWQDGDAVAGGSMGSADYYIPGYNPKFPIGSQPVKQLQAALNEHFAATPNNGKRVWVVLESHRGGLDNDLYRWLSQHGVFEAKFSKKRLDYAENNVEVWLISSNPSTPIPVRSSAGD